LTLRRSGIPGLVSAGAALLCGLWACAPGEAPVDPEVSTSAPVSAEVDSEAGAGSVVSPGHRSSPPTRDGDELRREVVFLIDVSASMPRRLGGGKFADFAAVVQAARTKAHTMLEPFEGDDSVSVSFYRFGNIQQDADGAWQPDLRPVADNVSVREAIAGLDEYFPAEPSVYSDGWTYVAASVYDLAKKRLDIVDPCESIHPSEERPHLLIFALTDQGEDGGGESSPTCARDQGRCSWDAENERRKAWLERQRLSNALSYTHWDMGNDNLQLIPPDQAVYRVQWVSKLKGQFNLGDPEQDPTPQLGDFEPRLRLLPEATRPTLAFEKQNPELICQPRRVDKLTESESRRASVDLLPVWMTTSGTAARDPLDGLELVTGPRGLRDNGRAIAPSVLRADLEGTLELPIPLNERLAMGQHALRLTKDSLCEALKDAYPNSTFLLPPDLEGIRPALGDECELPPKQGDYALARVGSVALVNVETVPTYRFELSSDGVPVNGPVTFEIDRWWRGEPVQVTAAKIQERRVRLSHTPPPAQPEYHVKYELFLLQDGQPVEHFYDDVISFGDGRTVLDEVPANQPVVIRLPGKHQRFYAFGTDFRTGARPGSYEALLCVEPDVGHEDQYRVEVSCEPPDCVAGASSPRSDGNQVCVPIAVEVGSRPFFSWWCIFLITLVVGFSIYTWLRWHFRLRFDPQLVVGDNACRLRWEQECKPGYQLSRRIRAFRHAFFHSRAGPVFYIVVAHAERGQVHGLFELPLESSPMLGIRALRDGVFAIWLVRLESSPAGMAPYQLFLRHRRRTRELRSLAGIPDPLGDSVEHIDLRGPGDEAVLRLMQGSTERASWTFRLEAVGGPLLTGSKRSSRTP
jgi:hypothetical protein